MYFKRLEMHGFKSFAEPVVIEFHEGVTAVVGPNGSGKSNISDAIRWVLGEQSPKALRGGKMEEVIFAGTASRKSRGMAEVTLVIDNSTGILPIDYNEVAITRRMFRSGESEYLINNNHCRLRDIRELIMDTGIGVDGYSIIGQGKIADIVSNKPESRREIFEEAAGVVMYKSRKAEAEKKLASTSMNLERIDDIIGEIEGRIDGLREDSIKAKEYLELKERFQDLEINIILKNIENLSSKNETFKQDIAMLKKELEEYEKTKGEVDAQMEADREKSEHLEQLANEARDRLLHIVEEVNKLSSESQLNQERLSTIEKDKIRVQGEISGLLEKLEKEQKNADQLEKAKTEILEETGDAEAALQEKIEAYSLISRKVTELSDAIDQGKERLFRLHNSIAAKNSEIRSYDSIKDALNKRKQQLSDDAVKAVRNKEDSQAQLDFAEVEMQEHLSRIESVTEKLTTLVTEQKRLLQQGRENRLQMEELKLQGSQKTSRKKTIEEMESNYEGYNFAVKYMMRAGLKGIDGVVAELMEVPAGLETAIETALGAQMQNIICKTDQDAKRGVSLLKENRAGRLTFLPVSSIKGSRNRLSDVIEKDEGYKGLAVDCISFDSQYQNVFEYLLGRVAVVDNMDTAIRLSKIGGGSIRFVTLDGEIVNVSGAITGGKYKNKTANLLERKSEITKLETEIQQLRTRLIAITKEEETSQIRLKEIEQEVAVLETEKREAELAKAALESSISALQDVLTNFESDRETADRELLSIQQELCRADETVEALRQAVEAGTVEIGELNGEIERLMISFEEEKSAADESSEEITKTRIAVNQCESKKSAMENLLARVTETMEDYRFQIEEKEHELTASDEEKNRILFGTGDREECAAALLKEKEEVENYIEAVTGERNALNEKIARISREQQAAGDKLNACRDQKYQLDLRVGKNETQLETLKERLWDEFEISYAQALDFKRSDFVLSTSVKESREIRSRIRALGDVNVSAINEYEQVSQRYELLTTQREDVVTAMDDLRSIIDGNDATIKSRFKETFDQIVDNFEDIFKELFGGGHAELRVEDESNPLESGIDIIAQPPGKKLQNINLMSGGEKTMTAIALMFAVLKTKPTPFCILDEVEAALDDANIERFARALRKFENIQFTLVTHQKATMEHADVLYGVTMPEHGISRVLSLRLGDDFEI